MPAARHLMETHGITFEQLVSRSGKGGRVTKFDVLETMRLGPIKKEAVDAFAPSTPAPATTHQPSSTTPVREQVPITSMRRAIARNLTDSKKNLAHFYLSATAEIDDVLRARAQLKEMLGKSPSVNDMCIKAAALALRDVPAMNVHVQGSDASAAPASRAADGVHVSIAVATPSGLITPIIRDADKKSVLELSAQVKELAGRAKEGRLALEEFQAHNSSFTISNLGMFGIDHFNAIIAPPQSAIMAVGKGEKAFAVRDDDSMQAVTRMKIELSVDRRAVDELTAAAFVQAFKKYMSNGAALGFMQ